MREVAARGEAAHDRRRHSETRSQGGHDVGPNDSDGCRVARGAAIIVVAAWLDTDVMQGLRQREAATYSVTERALVQPLGYLAITGGILRWCSLRGGRDLLFGLAYVLVGAFFAFLVTFLVTFVWTVAAQVNDAPSVLPEPIAVFLSQVYLHAESGPLNAVAIIGAGMLLIGLATIGLGLRSRASAAQSEEKGPTKAQVNPHQEPGK